MKDNWEKGEKLEVGILLFVAFWIGVFLMIVIFAFWNPCNAAELIHYSPWLTFTDDADRERQIDSVGAVCDTLEEPSLYVAWGDGSPVMVTNIYCRQIVFVEIREWPSEGIWIGTKENIGTFRVAWEVE